jgi:hypothetical protein
VLIFDFREPLGDCSIVVKMSFRDPRNNGRK